MALSKSALAASIVTALKLLDAGGGKTVGEVMAADTNNPSAETILTGQWEAIITEIVNHIIANTYVKLKDDMVSLRSAISSAVPVATDGGAALKAAIMASPWGTANFSSKVE